MSPPPSPSLRWMRVLALALPLIVLNCAWIAHSEMTTRVTEITITTLFMGVVFLLFLTTLANLLVRRLFGPTAGLRHAELMALYALLSLSSSVAGIGNFGFFTPFPGGAFWYGAQNNWERFHSLLPASVGPRDRAVLRGFYEGHSNFFAPGIWQAWAPTLTYWGLFFFLLLATTLCVAALLRRRWEEQENLPFPVVALPVALTAEGAPLLKNGRMWLGFCIPLFFHTLNTLNGLFPSLPTLPINKSVELMASVSPPWTGFGTVQLLLHPVGVGFGYLIAVDVLFSMWFFWALKKALNFFGATMNWRDIGADTFNDRSEQFPFVQYQAWGAWLAVGLAALWTGRRYFAGAWTRPGDRPFLGGAAGGYLALCGMCWAVGAPGWLPPVFLGLHLLLMLALARLEAETAVISPLLIWVDPQSMITTLAGSTGLSRLDLAHTATLSWFNLDYRAAAMPQQLQGMVGVRRAGGDLRRLGAVLLLAIAVAIVAALLIDMQLYYTKGAATAQVNSYRLNMGNSPWNRLAGWLAQTRPPNAVALGNALLGATLTGLLSWCRTRFVGFPLSPAAYVLNLSWANELFWLDLFVAWCFKAAFLRYGGLRLYRSALPFFLGLILGDFVTGSFWSLTGVALGVEIYRTFPN